MKAVGLLVWLVVLASSIFGAERVITLEDEYRMPILLGVDQEQFYVFDTKRIVINEYSLKSGSRLRSFCRKGQGPGECRWIKHLSFHNNRIAVSAGEKVMYFDRNGRYIEESKAPYAHIIIIPIGENFICQVIQNGRSKTLITARIFNSDFSNPRELEQFVDTKEYRAQNGKANIYIFKDFFGYDVTDQTAVVGNTQKGFHFGIYDKDGNKVHSIEREYKKIKVTEEHKKDHNARLLNLIGQARYKRSRQKYNAVFPEHYPAYKDFVAHDQNIYVRLYPIVNNTQELLVMDLKGNTISRHSVPTTDTEQGFKIWKSHYCYMKEDPDQEKWQLHLLPLK